MKNKLLIIILMLNLSANARELSWNWWPTGIEDGVPANLDTLKYNVGLSAVASSGQYAPFWLQSNTNGDISASPFSGNLSVGIYKESVHPNRWWDYDFAVQLTGRAQSPITTSTLAIQQKQVTGYFNMAYAHVRLFIFDITADRKSVV